MERNSGNLFSFLYYIFSMDEAAKRCIFIPSLHSPTPTFNSKSNKSTYHPVSQSRCYAPSIVPSSNMSSPFIPPKPLMSMKCLYHKDFQYSSLAIITICEISSTGGRGGKEANLCLFLGTSGRLVRTLSQKVRLR